MKSHDTNKGYPNTVAFIFVKNVIMKRFLVSVLAVVVTVGLSAQTKNADEVKFDGFKDVEPLQRREFSRIYSGKNILIEGNDGGIIRAKIINISAGGMKIETNKKIDIGHDLNVNFSLDKNTSVKCQFTPLSQSSDEESPDKFCKTSENCHIL